MAKKNVPKSVIMSQFSIGKSTSKQRLRKLGQKERTILFLDNCSALPSEDEFISADGKITAKCQPPSVTALLQPMD